MGYYMQTSGTHGKAAAIADRFGAVIVSKDVAEAAMDDPTKGVIVVVNNGPFEAAGFAFDRNKWEAFTRSDDRRPRQFVILDRVIAERESGFTA